MLPDVMDTALFCLWLTPSPMTASKLSLLIQALAEKHKTPRFDPHITLAISRGVRDNAAREQAREWMRDTATEAPSMCVSLADPSVGKTRHQCVLSAVSSQGEGYQRLQTLNAKAYELLAGRDRLESAPPNESFFPHLSLLYSDMEEKQRVEVAKSIKGFSQDNEEVDLAGIEVWEVLPGKPEEEWVRMGRCSIGAQGDAEVVVQEESAESDADSDDWEASVEGFTPKQPAGGHREEDWESRGRDAGDDVALPSRMRGVALDEFCDITTDNILEAYDFADYIDNWQRDKLLQPLRQGGAVTQGVDGSHWLVVFRSGDKSASALKSHSHSTGYSLRRYEEASKVSRAIPMSQIQRPKRPATSSKVASRLILGALGGPGRARKHNDVASKAHDNDRGCDSPAEAKSAENLLKAAADLHDDGKESRVAGESLNSELVNEPTAEAKKAAALKAREVEFDKAAETKNSAVEKSLSVVVEVATNGETSNTAVGKAAAAAADAMIGASEGPSSKQGKEDDGGTSAKSRPSRGGGVYVPPNRRR